MMAVKVQLPVTDALNTVRVHSCIGDVDVVKPKDDPHNPGEQLWAVPQSDKSPEGVYECPGDHKEYKYDAFAGHFSVEIAGTGWWIALIKLVRVVEFPPRSGRMRGLYTFGFYHHRSPSSSSSAAAQL